MSKPVNLSIVIPIKNMAGRLSNLVRTIEPALELKAEVILILDGCVDDTEAEIFAHFHKRKDELIILTTTGVGPGAARNIGKSKATKEWIVFWDSDDVGYVNTVNEILNSADAATTDLIVGRYGSVRQSKEYLSNSLNEFSPLKSMASSCLHPGIWRMVFRRSLVREIDFGLSGLGEDQVFLTRVLNLNPDVWFASEKIYTYFIGLEHQITSKSISVADLSTSIGDALKCLSGSESKFKEAQYVMVLKQIVTLLKHGRESAHLSRIMVNCLRYFSELAKKPDKELFYAMKFIWGNFRYYKKVNHLYLTGGLGNQLFQMAAAIEFTSNRKLKIDVISGNPRKNSQGIADCFEYDFLGVDLDIEENHFPMITKRAIGFCFRKNLDIQKNLMAVTTRRLAELITTALLSIHFKKLTILKVCDGIGYDPRVNQSKFDTYFVGYFQSYKWLDNYFSEKSDFLELTDSPTLLQEYKVASEKEKPLIVHLRLGDYLLEEGFGTPDSSYYQEAIMKALEHGKFNKIWLFSDDPDIAIKRLPKNLPLEVRIMPNFQNSSAATLEAMRLGHGYVIANSTFSWWAAKLSHNKDSVVFYPYPWFKFIEMPKDLIPRIRFQAVPSRVD